MIFEDAAKAARNPEVPAESEHWSLLLFERNPFPMWIFDVESLAFLDVNEAAIGHYGYSREEFLSMTLLDIRPSEDLEVFMQDVAMRQTTYHADGPWRHRRKDGSIIQVEITVLPIDYHGRHAKFVMAMDVTARRLADEQLHNNIRNLARANNDLKQFAYAASHDLQEPIRNVVLFTQLLVQAFRTGKEEDLLEYSKHTLDGAKRIQDRVAGLRRYWEVGQVQPNTKSVIDSEAALRGVLENLRSRLDSIGAIVSIEPLPALGGDQEELTTVLEALIENAMTFQADRALRISVSAETSGRECRISVRDNGIGIAPAYCARIFDIFKRLSTATPGIGMGLAIARKIVECYGGRIWVESTEGVGSAFHFTWPAAGNAQGG